MSILSGPFPAKAMPEMPALMENAYAKLNLTLDILGKRRDGYHLLRSVFQTVTLCDRLSLTGTADGEIHVASDRPDLPCGEDNTVRRTAEAFFSAAGIRNGGISFSLHKKIPWQAGLGGGSADAAAALRLLNRYFSAGLSDADLSKIGRTVGADVPFCLFGGTALAEETGEKLTRLPSAPDFHVVICKPRAGIETGKAYTAFDRSGVFADHFTGPMLEALRRKVPSEVAKCTGNAFEATVSLPDVGGIKRRMLALGASAACMTGTGSAVYGLFLQKEKKRAYSCACQLAQAYSDVFLCGFYRSGENEGGMLENNFT